MATRKFKPEERTGEVVNHGPGLRFDFSPECPEREVRRVIEQHQGAGNAITIEAIAGELWREQWGFVKADSRGFPTYPYRENIQRAVKQCVHNLRRRGVKIASNRGSVPGYFIITNGKELADTVRPILRQALDELRTLEALTGKGFYTAELEGQQRLFESGIEKQ